MVERLKNLIEYPARILITGAPGSGKSLLAMNLILNLAEENKRCLVISYLQRHLIIEGFKKIYPDLENILGKNIFFGHIEPRDEDDFFEDIEYAVLNLEPEVILVDPLYPDIGEGVFHDICKILETKKITGIFCYSNGKYLYGLVDYIIEISMNRIGGKIKRELVLRSRAGDIDRSFTLTLKEGNVILEDLMP